MNIFRNKEVKNASWLIGGKVAQMILSFFIGLFTARYLGAANYGLINYATAYVTFFTSLCTLGINAVIIKDFVDNPKEQGMAIGTSIILRAVSSLFSMLMMIGIVSIIDAGEKETVLVVALSSIALIFNIFDTINYWFQSRYQSKITSIANLVAYLIVAFYKIYLLIMHKNIKFFALSTTLDYFAVAIINIVMYKKYNGQKLKFSLVKAKQLLSKSYNYILSGMMVAIYNQTDKLMIKQMINEAEVGYYSVASYLCTVWAFVLMAIIDSMYPTILSLYKINEEQFERKNRQLYAIVFYVSTAVSLIFTIFGRPIISIMYGESYLPAVAPLMVITWYCAFSYLGVARNAWIVCEDKQKYLKYMYFSAAIINIILNVLLIPSFGTVGAALASLFTQILTSLILPLMFKGMRKNVRLMIDAILLKEVFSYSLFKHRKKRS